MLIVTSPTIGEMLATMAPLTQADSGRYLSHDGTELPW